MLWLCMALVATAAVRFGIQSPAMAGSKGQPTASHVPCHPGGSPLLQAWWRWAALQKATAHQRRCALLHRALQAWHSRTQALASAAAAASQAAHSRARRQLCISLQAWALHTRGARLTRQQQPSLAMHAEGWAVRQAVRHWRHQLQVQQLRTARAQRAAGAVVGAWRSWAGWQSRCRRVAAALVSRKLAAQVEATFAVWAGMRWRRRARLQEERAVQLEVGQLLHEGGEQKEGAFRTHYHPCGWCCRHARWCGFAHGVLAVSHSELGMAAGCKRGACHLTCSPLASHLWEE